jgi:hypothetical protein
MYHCNVLSPSTPLLGTRVKAHYTVHNMLSQGSFYKILEFVINHVIKYNQLK